MRWLAGAIITILFVVPAKAQDPRSACNSLLKDGVRDYRGTQTDLFHYEKVKNWLSTSEASTYEKATQEANNLGFSIPSYFSLNFGSSSATKNYSQWKRDFLNSTYQQVASQIGYTDIVRETSKHLVDGFVKCVEKTSGGTNIWLDASSDTDFVIFFRYAPVADSGIGSTTIERFTATNVSAACARKLSAFVGKKLDSVQSVQCAKLRADRPSAVVLSTKHFGPTLQPVFNVYAPPPDPGRYTIFGYIGVRAVRSSSKIITYTVRAKPTDSELSAAPSGSVLTWSASDVREINQFEFPSTTNRTLTPSSSGPGNSCSLVRFELNKNATQLTTNVISQCRLTPPMGGGKRKIRLIGNPDFDTRAFLRAGRYSYNARVELEERLPIIGETKNFSDPNSLRSSWQYPYDVKNTENLSWNYVFEVTISSTAGGTFNLYRRPDGTQLLNSGPFTAVFSDDHSLTIFRSSADDRAANTQRSLRR